MNYSIPTNSDMLWTCVYSDKHWIMGQCGICGYGMHTSTGQTVSAIQAIILNNLGNTSIPAQPKPKLTLKDILIHICSIIILLLGAKLGLSIDYERSDIGQFADAYLHADFLNNGGH